MRKTFYLLLILLSFSCSDMSKNESKDSYEKKKESLEEMEMKNPKKFLSVSTTDRRNLIGQKVIKGTIKNIATVCWYKDVELKISFYSKTKLLLEENKEVIYEVIAAGGEQHFKTKYFTPKGTDNVSVEIIKATVVPKAERQ